MSERVLPGQTVGILGGGQLGRMLALAAHQMGYRVRVFSPERASPAAQVADGEMIADYADLAAVRQFARGVDVLTFEFENVPASAARAACAETRVRPSPEVLEVCQHRLREKLWLQQHDFPTVPFARVHDRASLLAAAEAIGFPAVLKTAGFGYDGKGQRRIDDWHSAETAASELRGELVYERFVRFARELSVLGARGEDGSSRAYGPVENRHHRHILDLTIAPATASEALIEESRELARRILETLGVVGVLAVELFETEGGSLLVNELAPRPHNSGHYSIEACATSQFEQQLRAICGLPLGACTQFAPAAMANLLGDLWWPKGGSTAVEPSWDRPLARSEVHLHLYGKSEPRPGRKMGHLTALARTSEEAIALVLAARADLSTDEKCR